MPANTEKENLLADLCEGIDGSAKNKDTGAYIKVLRGRKNKNYGNAEMAICVEAFEELKSLSPYGWVDKQGRNWIPVRLKVWDNKPKEEAVPTAPIADDTEMPF